MSHSDSENSDTSDEDYVPNEQSEEVLSADESCGECDEDEVDFETIQYKGKRSKHGTASKKRRKTTQQAESVSTDNLAAGISMSEDVKKKEEEDLWASFMKDTGFVSKSNRNQSTEPKPKVISPTKSKESAENSDTGANSVKNNEQKNTIKQVFEFAGEEVIVERIVDATTDLNPHTQGISAPPEGKGKGGLGNVLKQLGKKNKISTLEKSKLDWDRFKKEESLESELTTYNKGKHGYLERQDFLQRADLRQFEIEKNLRTVERSKRLN